jgi:hypothetical protein
VLLLNAEDGFHLKLVDTMLNAVEENSDAIRPVGKNIISKMVVVGV